MALNINLHETDRYRYANDRSKMGLYRQQSKLTVLNKPPYSLLHPQSASPDL